jgi:hypothetical protein
MQFFNKETQSDLLNTIPLADRNKFVVAYDKMVEKLNEIEKKFREKYKELYPEFNLDNVIAFFINPNTKKVNRNIDVAKKYNKIDYMDQTVINNRCDEIIRINLNTQVIKFLD